jgi:hypothetical protein
MTKKLDNDFYSDGSVTSTTPLNNPRIGYQNIINDGSLTASASVAGFESSSLLNSFTYDLWKPASFPASLNIDAGKNVYCDYLGIAAHALSGCKVVLTASQDNVNFFDVTEAVIDSDDALMLLFNRTLARYWTITITGWATDATASYDFVSQTYEEATYDSSDAGDSHIGVVYLGEALAMPRGIYQGHAPGKLQQRHTYQNNDSDGGQWLGRSIVRRGYVESFAFKNIPAAFYRASIQPFVDHAVSEPFFIAWRPGQFADEAIFGRSMQDIEPNNSGPINFMSFNLNIEGHRSA